MTRKKSNPSMRNSTQETKTSSQATAPGTSHRPHNKIGWFLKKLEEDVKKLTDSCSLSPAPRNVHHDEHASSTPDIVVQATSSNVEADTQSAVQDAQQSANCMHPLLGPAITAASVVKGAQEDLDDADSLQETYLKPLRIFDDVIGKIADLHPYAKMALGMLSWTAKVILAQADRDAAVLELLKKLSEVYDFMTQDRKLNQKLSTDQQLL
ncbi:uncharacterized protein F5147DRAFT_654925 [Suillus discolor]|uniref:Uncharacterized protein n=1 Tax=Suillus discolor TaxID=1912936 RepID=A0A9P7F1E1_9AGAM|nr:uncharacterized protein F5147DRAFT_654925 [Suillus discolor]KAG2102842.1 hypothetical protein F5147DRAFT_654925 [Suillus discolor]